MKRLSILLSILLTWNIIAFSQEADDPYLWLENIEGEESLEWVAAHNEKTLAALQEHPAFDSIYQKNLKIYNSEERISNPEIQGDYGYDFWQDEQHERGIWRRRTLESYLCHEPVWETLLDIDSLAEAEGENWVFGGADFLPPACTRCMIILSRGGGEGVNREFDVEKKAFVEDGFFLPQRSGRSSWKDENTLYVTITFDEDTTTRSGFEHVVKAWKRGTPLEEAEVIFKNSTTDAAWCWTMVDYDRSRSRDVIVQQLGARKFSLFVLEQGRFIRLEVPKDAMLHGVQEQMVVYLQSDWSVGDRTYQQGEILGIDYDDFRRGSRDFKVIYQPDEQSYWWGFASTKNYLLVVMLRNVCPEVYRYWLENEQWVSDRIPTPDFGSTWIYYGSSNPATDLCFITYSNFLEPWTLCLVREDGTIERVGSDPAFFDPDPFVVHQYEAVSRDGTRVPYFIIHSRNMALDGTNPTLLTGYGGYGESLTPGYDPVVGSAWLERGGVYVVATIRGGGEFGPNWHRAAQGKNRQRSFDDFIAVAEDLIARGITSPGHLGIKGASHGGLLVGAVFTQRPTLFNAVACLNPVLDMKRTGIRKDEYGDPNNPDDWAYIRKYSPYHNVSRDSTYPKVLFVTSRTDRLVDPWQARKMAARMEEMGHDVYFFETSEGGHGSAVTPHQSAFRDALIYTYLLEQLK